MMTYRSCLTTMAFAVVSAANSQTSAGGLNDEWARRLMLAETNAAIEGAFAGGRVVRNTANDVLTIYKVARLIMNPARD